MNYYLFKLRFLSPLCAGDGEDARGLERAASTIGGDTLFSALCQEALAQGGTALLDRLAGWAAGDRLRLSDLLPFAGEDLLLPRPALPRTGLPRTAVKSESAQDRKGLKKLAYLPLTALPDYLAALRGEGEMDPEGWRRSFGESTTRTLVAVSGQERATPYTVGAFRFYGMTREEPSCGLYGLLGYEDDAIREVTAGLLRGLGISGIGGKRSIGCGRFEVAGEAILRRGEKLGSQEALLLELLEAAKAPGQLLLTTSFPAREELESAMEGAWYQLRRRGGFINSRDYAPRPVKRQTQYFFAPGSGLSPAVPGELADLSQGGGHPVYRCSRPLFLGVTP